jgi:F0F1-type ATP synthase assembly protein I
MLGGQSDPKEMGFYLALSQVGLEMVIPVVIGALLDHYLGWTPWAIIIGAVLGLVGGLSHLVAILNRNERTGSSQDGQNKQR